MRTNMRIVQPIFPYFLVLAAREIPSRRRIRRFAQWPGMPRKSLGHNSLTTGDAAAKMDRRSGRDRGGDARERGTFSR
jgi:hypothetical protein